MTLTALFAYLTLGVIAGVMAGLLGVGGGLVIVPALAWLFRDQGIDESVVMHLAIGSSLATIIVTSIGSVRAHHHRDSVIWAAVARLTPGILTGAFLGGVAADQLSTTWLQRFFALFVILVGLQMAMNRQPKAHRELPGALVISLAGSGIGFLSALVGIGGGSLTVPYLAWHSVPMVKAVGTSSACGVSIAIAGATGFLWMGWGSAALPSYSTGYLYWPAIVGIIVTSYAMTPLGARLAHRLPVLVLKRLFAGLLILIGMRLLY